jgi:hypothetical protein
MRCASLQDDTACVEEAGVPVIGGTNYWCRWLQPRRYRIVAGECNSAAELLRCVAGYFVGEVAAAARPTTTRTTTAKAW